MQGRSSLHVCLLLLSIQTSSPAHLPRLTRSREESDTLRNSSSSSSKGVLKELPEIWFSLGFSEGSAGKRTGCNSRERGSGASHSSYKNEGKRLPGQELSADLGWKDCGRDSLERAL